MAGLFGGGADAPQPNKRKIARRQNREREAGSIQAAIREQGVGLNLLRAREQDRKRREV